MTIDLEGMLQNAADCIHEDADEGGYRWTLPELGRNIRRLKMRLTQGDTSVIDEFFKLYHVDENRETP